MFEPYPRLLDRRRKVTLAKFQLKLACLVNDYAGNVHGLVLLVGGSGDVIKLEKFFDGKKDGCDWVSRVLCRLLDNVLTLKEFMWHQLTVVLLEVSDNVRHGVLDGISHAVADIREICLLDCGNDLLHKSLLDYRHFAKKNTFLVSTILMLEFMWVVVPSRVMSGPK